MAGLQQDGYESDFVEEVLDRYICNICTKPLRDPQLVVCCGQHFCQLCLNQWFQKHHPQSCPHCRAEGVEFQYVVDKKLKREILSLRVKCGNKQEGCEWTGELGSLNGHMESPNGCGFVEVECPNRCYEKELRGEIWIKIKRKDVDRHLRKHCFNRQYNCEHCGKRDKYVDITGYGTNFNMYKYHYQECPEMVIQCPNKCGAEITRKENKNHRSQCPLETVQCPNKCKSKTSSGKERTTEMLRKDLGRHLKERCYLRPYKCEHCDLKLTYEAITGKGIVKHPKYHYQTCKEYPRPCPNNCGTVHIKRKDMEDHRSHCPEEIVPCPNKCRLLGRGIKRKNLEKHVKEECPFRQYSCMHCKKKDTYIAITKHYDYCPKYPLECRNRCRTEGVTRGNMMIHISKHCPLQPVECPFAEAGCKAKPGRQDLENHTSTMQQHHLLMVMGAFQVMKKDLQQTKDELHRTENTLRDSQTELNKTKQELRQTRTELRESKTGLTQTKRDLEYVKKTLTQCVKKEKGQPARPWHPRQL